MEMTRTWQNRALTTLADFPFIPYLSEDGSKTTFSKRLFPSVITGIFLECTLLSSLWEGWVLAMHILAPLVESIQSRDSTWALTNYVSIASILRQILFCQFFHCNNLFTCFPTHMTQFRILFNGSQSFLASLSSIYSQQGIGRIILTRSGSPVKQL